MNTLKFPYNSLPKNLHLFLLLNDVPDIYCLYFSLIFDREILQLKDGGEVALDWKDSDCEKDSPIIIILPGLTGESQADYIKCLVAAANQIGIRCCVFINRGLGGIALKTPRLYCAANCEDLSEVVNYVYINNPNVLIAATGKTISILVCSYACDKHFNK